MTDSTKNRELVISMARHSGKSVYASNIQQLLDDWAKHQTKLHKLELSEGKIFGARYHTVQPYGGDWAVMEQWCIEMFGDPAELWEAHNFSWPDCGRWYQNNSKFWFRDHADASLFLLKWTPNV